MMTLRLLFFILFFLNAHFEFLSLLIVTLHRIFGRVCFELVLSETRFFLKELVFCGCQNVQPPRGGIWITPIELPDIYCLPYNDISNPV
ncbi:hypothetical protein BCR42DRAFT_158769 [Absidia repens]|uniref:Uncharacterized protein n=1 Tax=Absidia repens TaxID=90262 RepID=A0A1X2I0I6_9FUNG|nr:hypothetical protein BCR42DRAFT_158769 [Absidia repens]